MQTPNSPLSLHVLALALAFPLLTLSQPAAAETRAAPLSAVVDARGLWGNDDVAGLSLFVGGAGFELAIAPTLRARALALGLLPFGETPDGRSSHGGAGGELGLRLTPFQAWPVRPFAAWSAGLLFFPRAPFLPQGDEYEFFLSFGAGLDVSLSERVTLGAQVHYSHLSNGQGLVPQNPAYDGVGGTLSLTAALGELRPVHGVWEGARPIPGERPAFAPGVLVDASLGRLGSLVMGMLRGRGFWSPTGRLLLGLDAAAGDFDGAALADVGGLVCAHGDAFSAGLRAGYRGWAGLHTFALETQLEAHLSPEVTLLAMASFERTFALGHVTRSALGVRMFPLRSLTLDLGVGFDRIGDAPFGDASDPYVGVEWQLPLSARSYQVSLFLERQVSTIDMAGVRMAWGMGRTLRDVARRNGFRQVR